jgi:hypothetical protein
MLPDLSSLSASLPTVHARNRSISSALGHQSLTIFLRPDRLSRTNPSTHVAYPREYPLPTYSGLGKERRLIVLEWSHPLAGEPGEWIPDATQCEMV